MNARLQAALVALSGAAVALSGCLTTFPRYRPSEADAGAATDGSAPGDVGAGFIDAVGADASPPPPTDAQRTDAAPPPDAGSDSGAPKADDDGDGLANAVDNCVSVSNADQADADGDDVGDACDPCPHGGEAVDADGDAIMACAGDCDDGNPAIFPGALERCDGIDNDCDQVADEDFAEALGTACEAGLGACRATGVRICAADGAGTRCDAPAGVPVDETCNQADDDCDGEVDEGLVGCCRPGEAEACGTDVGACAAGRRSCDANGLWGPCDGLGPAAEVCNTLDDDCDGETDEGVQNACLQCGPEPAERCDGLDNDCDRQVDEDFGLDAPCEVGVGACRRRGLVVCGLDGGAICGAQAGPPSDEICNGIDDDCDGEVDEGLADLGACVVGFGACAATGRAYCDAAGQAQCAGEPFPPAQETCNGIDDDCDGVADNGFDLGSPCQAGVGACHTEGLTACDDAGGVRCDAPVRDPDVETCNGIDDDCDGSVDEETACRDYIYRHCATWLVLTGEVLPAQSDALVWDGCPVANRDDVGATRCASSRLDPATGRPVFGDIATGAILGATHQVGVGFTCTDAADPATAAWLQGHCAVYLGWVDNVNVSPVVDAWGACPAAPAGDADGVPGRCVSSQWDGHYHAMFFPGAVSDNDEVAVAFRCDAPDEPLRAAGAQSSAWIWLGFDQDGPSHDGAQTWDACTLDTPLDNATGERCVGTQGDGRFHGIELAGGSKDAYVFGVQLGPGR